MVLWVEPKSSLRESILFFNKLIITRSYFSGTKLPTMIPVSLEFLEKTQIVFFVVSKSDIKVSFVTEFSKSIK